MMEFALNKEIVFYEEPNSPYTVQAINARYAVLTRPATPNDFEIAGVEYIDEGDVVYCLVDNQTWRRGPHNLVLNPFEFKTRQGCEEALEAITTGMIELSSRHTIPVLV